MKIIYYFKIPAGIILAIALVAGFVFISMLDVIEMILTLICFICFVAFWLSVICLILIIFSKDHWNATFEEVLTFIGCIIMCSLGAWAFGYKMYDRFVLANEIIKNPVELKIENTKKTVQTLINFPVTERQNGTRIIWENYKRDCGESYIECTRSTGGYIKFYLGKKYKYFSVDTYSTDDFSVYADDVLIDCNEKLTDNDEEHINKKFFVINKCEYLKIEIDDELDLDNVCVYKAKYKKLSKKKLQNSKK